MIIFPAIDLYEKKAVRLYKGDYANMTVYSEDPLAVARDFEAAGATHIHMVDLEGARDGTTPNLDVVSRVARETSLFVDRVILGTAAVTDPVFLKEAVGRYGEHISVGADVKDGAIAIRGWLETASVTLDDFLRSMQEIGVGHVICTDISKDGAMRGTNRELYAALSRRYDLLVTAGSDFHGEIKPGLFVGMNGAPDPDMMQPFYRELNARI